VKEAISKRSGKSFAIKIITKSQLQEEEKLQDEISLMRQLSHPNILSLDKVFEDPEYYFLVTENMSGGDLLSRLSDVSFFNEHQGRQMCQVFLDAIAYMHTKKIVSLEPLS
jgi:serine/threonine protein kinase